MNIISRGINNRLKSSTAVFSIIRLGGGGGGAPVVPLFDFELFNTDGTTTITNSTLPNMRVSLNGGTTWQSLTAAGLTLARHIDGDKLVVSGWASNAIRDAALFHFEQALPEEPNNASTVRTGLFASRVGDAGPANIDLAGMSVSATVYNLPIGVTP